MSKVYLKPRTIFNYFGVLALIFGVTPSVSSQSTAGTSGETDGIYYSPSKDGQIASYTSADAQDYDIKVGSPYFDANGNGAEDFYYGDGTVADNNHCNNDSHMYTGHTV